MRASARAAIVGAAALLASAGPARADAGRCQAALATHAGRHARAVLRALAACRARVLTGTRPAATDCGADPEVVAATAEAARKARAGIARRCCGRDGACGTTDDEPLAGLGWQAAVCPGFADAPCAGAIASPGDVATCLTCAGAAGAGRVAALGAGFAAAAGSLGRCRGAIGAAATKVFVARSQALGRCWAARARGRGQGVCPGAVRSVVARAEAAARTRICRACGGADARCGGADDADPETLGFAPACPAVTVPRSVSCGRPVATVEDIVACVACVTAFAGDCADRLAVPAFAPDPPECHVPAPACEAGIECADDGSCPHGYACRDNGGGARYCVGSACAADAACAGGGVCRQYCTLEGCGTRRCQCPGFGCSFASALCIDDGGLACRRLCTQDSDCTDPFEHVCINSGFADGLCIGSAPCQ